MPVPEYARARRHLQHAHLRHTRDNMPTRHRFTPGHFACRVIWRARHARRHLPLLVERLPRSFINTPRHVDVYAATSSSSPPLCLSLSPRTGYAAMPPTLRRDTRPYH